MCITYPTKELLTIDNDVSSTYRYIKLYPDIVVANAFIIEHILYLPLDYPFGSNVIGYIWKILAYSYTSLLEYYQSSLDVDEIVLKHSNLTDKIRKSKDAFQY